LGKGWAANVTGVAAKSGSPPRLLRSLVGGVGVSEPPRHTHAAVLLSGGQAGAASSEARQHGHAGAEGAARGVVRQSPAPPTHGRITSDTIRRIAMNPAFIVRSPSVLSVDGSAGPTRQEGS
jgi:hypothetical protein